MVPGKLTVMHLACQVPICGDHDDGDDVVVMIIVPFKVVVMMMIIVPFEV